MLSESLHGDYDVPPIAPTVDCEQEREDLASIHAFP